MCEEVVIFCFPVECKNEESKTEVSGKRKAILESLANGEISVDKAVALLRQA
ncbi:MAG: DUF2089 domain-containing protein [Firmicutes bacterium]|nr:DUF2089 domain-containing protein [Bacillota bacterium]